MTQREKLARAKMSLIELAEYLKNVSEACRVMGVSRQHFYDIKKAYADGGIPALQEKSRRKPNLKNRVAPEIEDAVVRTAEEYPALDVRGYLVRAAGGSGHGAMSGHRRRP